MTADEINEGLNRYVWPENIAFMEREGIAIDWVRFTDSLDACERVADKLGVLEFTSFIWEPDAEYKAHVIRGRASERIEGGGPTRAHAMAAALYAAVDAQDE